jgi:hypothetical protein
MSTSTVLETRISSRVRERRVLGPVGLEGSRISRLCQDRELVRDLGGLALLRLRVAWDLASCAREKGVCERIPRSDAWSFSIDLRIYILDMIDLL